MARERQTKKESLGIKAAALALSAVLHILLFSRLPLGYTNKEAPIKDTVLFDLVEKKEGEAETTQQTAPEGTKAEASAQSAKTDPGKSASDREAERGRAAPNARPPAPPRRPGGEPGEKSRDKPQGDSKPRERPPDPTQPKTLEATVSLEETDSRYEGFLGEVRKAVNRQWNSRDALLVAQRSGLVTVRFTLARAGGKSGGVTVLKSSQSRALDDEAERAVSAATFPAFPGHWKLERLNLVGQFEYSFDSEE